jgi:hypothetical protein
MTNKWSLFFLDISSCLGYNITRLAENILMPVKKHKRKIKMSQRAIQWILRVILLLSLAGLVFVLFNISPYQEQDSEAKISTNIIIFFSFFFLFWFSFFSLFLFSLKKRFLQAGDRRVRNRTIQPLLKVSLRQGFLLGLGASILLTLQAFRVFTWWDGLLALGAVLMVELYFLSR